MATIAKGMITLVNVNDAYTVSATPNVCAIKADFDGTHPVLDDAYCDITVVRGDVKVPFTINLITPSHTGIKYEVTGTDLTKRLTLTEIPVDALSGTVTVEVGTEDEFVATVIFQYSVMREATMLDWIKDWENNKTTIGSTYLITPKIFVGKREQVTEQNAIGELTGVYIGPSDIMGGACGPGIYGYKSGKEIFHINRDNAKIANWEFDETALWLGNKWRAEISDFTQSNEITLGIDGIIGHHWRLLADGSGKLAGGNISWTNEGVLSINLNGEDVATTLTSYGSTIASHATRIGTLEMSAEGFSTHFEEVDNTLEQHSSSITDINGSVTTINGTLTSHATRIGTLEMSAEGFSTHFEEVDNTLEQHSSSITQNATQITTVVTGLTNTGINITDGVIDLHSGTNSWSLKSNGDSMISGWLIKDTRLATDNICLESSNGVMGLYMSVASSANFKTRVSNLEDFIDSNGGIYMQVNAASGSKAASANLAAYDSNGYKVFKLKTEGECNIAGWTFDKNDLFVGNQAYTTDFTPDEFSITLSPKGLFGHQWKFLQNGAGAIAGGNIKWDSNGEVEFGPSVRLHWMNDIAHVDEKVIISQQMAYGKMLYRNPEFANNDLNDVRLYPHNTSCGNMKLATSEIAPNTSGKMLEIVSNQWHSDSDHRLAGFYFANRSRPNAKFVVRIIALIPENWKINNYHNAYGDGGTTKWLTSQEGTGKWEEYLCVVKCGRDGEFNTINHFALSLSENSDYIDLLDTGNTNIQLSNKNTMDFHAVSAVTWYVAYATVIDLTASDKLTTSIDINGIYTGTLRADQIVSGVIDTKLLNVDDIFANGQIQAKQVLSPFVEITLPNDFGYSGFNVSKAYNSFFAPSESGRYIFLPCDVSQSGRTITIHYSQTDRTSAPIVILCDNINARFLQLYQTQKYSSDDKIRVIQLTAGCTVQLIAIPHRSGYSPDLPENSTNNFVNWYMIGYDAERDIEMVVMRDDMISDELWTDYHNTINGTLLGNA